MMYNIGVKDKEEKEVEKKYFYGNEISEYGLEHGYVDYRTLAKSFDAVLNNDIMGKTYDIGYWEQVSGMIDNSDEIEKIDEKIEELENMLADFECETNEDIEEYKRIESEKEELEEEKEELKRQEEEEQEIFQYYIVSDNGARILEEANEIVYYNEELDMYLWGVTHWGTSWDYVLTDIEIDW